MVAVTFSTVRLLTTKFLTVTGTIIKKKYRSVIEYFDANKSKAADFFCRRLIFFKLTANLNCDKIILVFLDVP